MSVGPHVATLYRRLSAIPYPDFKSRIKRDVHPAAEHHGTEVRELCYVLSVCLSVCLSFCLSVCVFCGCYAAII